MGADGHLVADGQVPADTSLAGDDGMMPNGGAPGDADLAGDDGVFSHDHVVCDMHLIVRLDTGFNPCLAHGGAINGVIGPNFDIIVNLDNADLGYFSVLTVIKHKTVAVTADDAAGMNNDPAAHYTPFQNGYIRIDDGLIADGYIIADDGVGVQHHAITQGDAVSDDHPCSHRDPLAQGAMFSDDGCWGNPLPGSCGRIKHVQYLGKSDPGIFDLD